MAMTEVIKILQDKVLPAMSAGVNHVIPGTATPLPDKAQAFRHFRSNPIPAAHYGWSWILRNQVLVKINGQIYPFAPGDFYFLPPLTSRADLFDPSFPPGESLWFIHGPTDLVFGHNLYNSTGQLRLPHHGRLAPSSEIAGVLHSLHREIGGATHSEPIINGLVLQLVGLLIRALEQQNRSDTVASHQGVSNRVQAFLRAHYAEELTLPEIARLTHFSPAHLAVIYKRETGKTIIETLTEIRIEHAASLLRTQHLPVRLVAEAVGYNNPEHFTRVFRRLKGVTPTDYSRNNN